MWATNSTDDAKEIFAAWYSWATRSRLRLFQQAARTLKSLLRGVLNAIRSGATNAHLEGLNSKIQALKRSACGFRSRDRFRSAIYFHLGGLDLYPDAIAHSNS